MKYAGLADFLARGKSLIGSGPLAILLMEDLCETNSTIRHHLRSGFKDILVFGPDAMEISPDLTLQIHRIDHDMHEDHATETVVNALIDACPGLWMYYCFNAEFLFFPFCETRTVGEVVAFATEERRDSILSYVVDLYADDLEMNKDGVSLPSAHLDQSGYYAQGRFADGEFLDRQIDMFGGLRWRFEEHIPWEKRRIDRISLFRARKGLKLLDNHTFNEPEYNTYACPWHNNVTAAVCSFRAAKSLRTNPGSAYDIRTFKWHNSCKFGWHSQQLMNMGLMEPGQWF